jgi:hypothetical protein
MTKSTFKLKLADQCVRHMGFAGLNDRDTTIGKVDLVSALPNIEVLHAQLVQYFKRHLTKRLRKGIVEPNDCIALLRSILRDRDIDMGVSTRKYNRRLSGKQTAVFQYRLLGR